MRGYIQRKFLLPIIAIFLPTIFFNSEVNAGSFGAEIFCTMRDGGNDHESSWEAAYSYIKRQKGGFFKVSPKQAAGQIVETVVREKEQFSYCIEYLNKLHPDRNLQSEKKIKKEEQLQEEENDIYSKEGFDRYSY